MLVDGEGRFCKRLRPAKSLVQEVRNLVVLSDVIEEKTWTEHNAGHMTLSPTPNPQSPPAVSNLI